MALDFSSPSAEKLNAGSVNFNFKQKIFETLYKKLKINQYLFTTNHPSLLVAPKVFPLKKRKHKYYQHWTFLFMQNHLPPFLSPYLYSSHSSHSSHFINVYVKRLTDKACTPFTSYNITTYIDFWWWNIIKSTTLSRRRLCLQFTGQYIWREKVHVKHIFFKAVQNYYTFLLLMLL